MSNESDSDYLDEACHPLPTTTLVKDSSKSLITYNASPDVGFDASINPYRGCEHGCIYCYARPTHEYLGFSAGLDFETKILVKEDAAHLLRAELSSSKWRPQVIAISGVTDPYQPVEQGLRITRQCLEVLAEFGNPVTIVTKNRLVTRDIDLLQKLAESNSAAVYISVTTLDPELARVMEPRTSIPQGRLAAIRELSTAGIPTGVLIAPVIPGLTDHEMPSILAASSKAGARFAGYVLVRLPYGVKELFEEWLSEHFPEKKKRILGRIRELRGGKLNDPNFRTRMKGQGAFSDQINFLFRAACRKQGISDRGPELSAAAFKSAASAQLSLFS